MQGAMVSIVIGQKYRQLWEKHCKPNWEAYAAKHGLDLFVVPDFIDQSDFGLSRAPNWHKLLIGRLPQLRGYSRVLWLDADVIINAQAAPNIFDEIPSGKVGAVRHSAFFENPVLVDAFHRVEGPFASVEQFRRTIYTNAGLPPIEPYINTGVLAFCDFDLAQLEKIYRHYSQEWTFADQVPLSFELAKAKLIWEVDPRFNVQWYALKYSVYEFAHTFLPELKRLCVAQALQRCYFLHFAGNQQDMEYYDPAITITRQQVNVGMESLEKLAHQMIRSFPENIRQSLLAALLEQPHRSSGA